MLEIYKQEIYKKAENNYSENPEGIRLAILDSLTDLCWDISSTKKIIEMLKEEIISYTLKEMTTHIEVRITALKEKEEEFKKLTTYFNELLTLLNNKS